MIKPLENVRLVLKDDKVRANESRVLIMRKHAVSL